MWEMTCIKKVGHNQIDEKFKRRDLYSDLS